MDTLALVMRPIIALLFLITFVMFLDTMRLGRAYVAEKRSRRIVFEVHVRNATLVLRLTITAVVLTEAYAWVSGRVLPHNWFFWLHLVASVVYLVGTWQLTHSWTGVDSPKVHKLIANVTVWAFGVALLSGYVRLFHELTRQLGLGWLLQ